MARSTIPLQPGAKLGPYKIEACIGAGGMGEVFRAVDTRLRRTVAVKLLPLSRSADPSHRQRFLREARSASALSHANIVSIYDLCSHDGYDFIVMEYIDGRTLKDMIGISSLPLHEIVELGAQIASALQAAHSAGIVHRDIKPANIMVTPNHQVKVLDFGIAKSVSALGADEDLEAETTTLARPTEAGVLIGTLAYMSPEQTRGEPVDRRSDIFSFGSLLYEASTGRLPFAGPSAFAVMQQIATATPPAPSSLRTELPVALDRLLAKCLEKAPERRPAQASEIGEALKSLTVATPAKAISAPAHDSRRTVAVVPLQFLASTQEDEFLSVALADAIANRLGSASTLIVRPTSSLLKYAGKKTDWTEIARELNVDLVVEGSIQKMGARVRVMVQACACRDSGTLHSAKIDGDANDLFDLQDRLADSVFNALTPHVPDKTARHALAPPARHPLAFELYMRAVDHALRFSKFELSAAVEMLERAIDLDPDFADAWGMLANVCYQMGAHVDQNPKWFQQAERAVARTLELDPVNCDAFCTQGMILWSPYHGFQVRPALRALNAALKINPSRFNARSHRGAVLFHQGFHEEAERETKESILANPEFALAHASLGFTAIYAGDYASADDHLGAALRLEPALVHANLVAPLPAIYSGDLKRAREILAKTRRMIPEEPQNDAIEGLILAREGDLKKAEELADKAVASKFSLVHTHHTWHCAAGVYAMCARPEKAIAELKRCAENGLPNHRAFENDPSLGSLHAHPEFISLMQSLRRDYEVFGADFGLKG